MVDGYDRGQVRVKISVSFACQRAWSGFPNAQGGLGYALDLSKLRGSHLQYDTPYSSYIVPSKNEADTLLVQHLYVQGSQVLFEVHQVYAHRTSQLSSPS